MLKLLFAGSLCILGLLLLNLLRGLCSPALLLLYIFLGLTISLINVLTHWYLSLQSFIKRFITVKYAMSIYQQIQLIIMIKYIMLQTNHVPNNLRTIK